MTPAEFRDLIASSRLEQGFPATVTDPATVDRLAAEIVGRVEAGAAA